MKSLRILAPLAASLSLFAAAPKAHAWKPVTHVYLAELVRQEMIANGGKVIIYAVDPVTGQVQRNADGSFKEIGRYLVDPGIRDALINYPSQFRAGCLGPDAYPDIMTGQEVIHPAGGNTPGQPAGVDINVGGAGSGAWLNFLWQKTQDRYVGNIKITAPAQYKAFVAGFFAHAAGDMYAHTFINHFAGGGPFHFTPRYDNALKHVLMEGYLEKRTPALESYSVSIQGVEPLIISMMDPDNGVLRGANTSDSVPYIFGMLRKKLVADVQAYNNLSAGKRAAYTLSHPGWITYKQHWIADIESGLSAWPALSHQMAQALFFNSNRAMSVTEAQAYATKYVTDHLLSMAGAPDIVGVAAGAIKSITEEITNALGLKAAIAKLKSDMLNSIVKSATGYSLDQLKTYVTSPTTYFDSVLNNPSYNVETPRGELVSLANFNKNYLHIADTGYNNPSEKFDWRSLAPAYNTVTMIKLSMLSSFSTARLLSDLGSPSAIPPANPMLDFCETLDGSNQWQANTNKMFMPQAGPM